MMIFSKKQPVASTTIRSELGRLKDQIGGVPKYKEKEIRQKIEAFELMLKLALRRGD